jgi:hypothetical protein
VTGIDHLARQRDELADLVDQLGGSALEDAPSLRLLADALRVRLRKLEEKLDEARRCELRVEVEGAAGDVGARITAALIATLSAAVTDRVAAILPDLAPAATDEAARLSLIALDLDDGGGAMVLASPPRPTEQLLIDAASGRPALVVALDEVCDELERDASDLLADLGAAIVTEPLHLRIHVRTPASERSVEVPRSRLQTAARAT